MKTLYLECAMGAAGDMLTAALLELVNDKADFLKQINSIGIPGLKVNMESVVKCGISGTHIRVSIDDGIGESCADAAILKYIHKHNNLSLKHSHTSFEKIENIIARLSVSQKVKDNALSIYRLIAGAEASAHGISVEQIHFHELGNADAIADIVGVCILMESLAPQETIASPINVGSGFVQCAHGAIPVPSPATAYILQDIPIYSRNAHEELCTPTGAAIIKHFVKRFEQMPKMRVQKIGYGMGTKDFEYVNCLRTFLGETENSNDEINDRIVQLQCNLDDMTGEAVGFAMNLLLQEGAMDVFTVPIQMKKNRPAVLLTCICNEYKAHFFAELILRHTTTFGIRRTICDRYALKRKTLTKQTLFGSIRIKTGEGYNIKKFKPEYDDIAEAAHLNNVSFSEVNDAVLCNKTNEEKKI
ncbi:UPF0272 protein [Endomicrobiia bacterium]|nr:UPF0272 protein [Endomicrobiia bacterium]GHT13606.1 UPF0272 protein [Endomicrobiia bacterium]GHT18987.1 UPF0272 protein [Endomicrobiia bacterium]GHT28231.1 UPF0272 protein [Endomicrobiia bacterium]GHT30936.1 UPF0272 protein [Endomicrobiia bacterium]